MSLAKDWNQGGANLARGQGSPNLRDIMNCVHGLADLTALKAIGPDERTDGMIARITGAGVLQERFKYVSASTLTGDDQLVVTPTDAPTAGRWILQDDFFDLKIAIDKTMADAAVLYTVPTGFILGLDLPFWEVSVSWTGGSSSAIGLSSSNAGLNTKGDLLGGASGDVAATLVSTGALAKGTKGAKIGTPPAVLVGGDTLRFDRITSAFTAGSGFAHVLVKLLSTP
jgi:hypothetical protein